ncbi:MAG: hypothetical protein KO463_01720 [Candidatus Methanofastidiosa archaeon]|nr:hypothetical protein [Candidatus Methanofastidiosa archaeon]
MAVPYRLVLSAMILVALTGVEVTERPTSSCALVLEEPLLLTFSSGPLSITRDGPYDTLSMEGFSTVGGPGLPRLPVAVSTYLLPEGVDPASVDLLPLYTESVALEGTYVIAPGDAPASTDGPAGDGLSGWRDEAVYGANNPYPSLPVDILRVSQEGSYVRVQVRYAPLSYRPLSGELAWYPLVSAQLVWSYLPGEKGASPPASYNGYIIVTTKYLRDNSAVLAPQFVPWLVSRGFTPVVITEDDYGWAQGQQRAVNIRAWLVAHQHTHQIRYVLLVGNPDPDDPSAPDTFGDVPMLMCWPQGSPPTGTGVPTDHFYADFSGTWDLDGDGYFGEYGQDGLERGTGLDFGPEAYVGRLPVYFNSTHELDLLLQRTMQYPGTNPSVLLPMAISNYAGEVMTSGSSYGPRTDGLNLPWEVITRDASPAGYANYVFYERTGLAPVPTTAYEYDAPLTQPAVVAAWHNDHGVAVWWGHGSSQSATRAVWASDEGDGVPEPGEVLTPPFITSQDFNAMQAGAHTFAFMCACYNATPEDPNHLSFAALFSGAMTTVGSTRLSYYAQGPFAVTGARTNTDLAYAYAAELVTTGASAGRALFEAKTQLSDLYGWQAFSWQNLMDFNLYGDPSLSLCAPAAAASLSASISAQPVTVASGAQVAVHLTVTNTGGSPALNVAPGALSFSITGTAHAVILSSPGPQVTLFPGQSHTFSWTLRAEGGAQGGTIACSSPVSGTDGGTSLALGATASSTPVTVLPPAALSIALVTRVSAISCTATAVVTNTGATAVAGVIPHMAAAVSGAGSVALQSQPSASVSLSPGSSASFVWVYRMTAPGGTLVLDVSATGTDTGSGLTVSSPHAVAYVPLQAAADLLLSISLSSLSVAVGEEVIVTATIANTGLAGAQDVTLSSWNVSGTAVLDLLAGPDPAQLALPAGSTGAVTYRYRAMAQGTVVVRGIARGREEGTAFVISSPEAGSPVLTVSGLSPYALLLSDIVAHLEACTHAVACIHGCLEGPALPHAALADITLAMAPACTLESPLVAMGQLIEGLDLLSALLDTLSCPCEDGG